MNGPWLPDSRTQLASRLRSSTSPPPKPSLKLTPARGPLKCTLPARSVWAVTAWNQEVRARGKVRGRGRGRVGVGVGAGVGARVGAKVGARVSVP